MLRRFAACSLALMSLSLLFGASSLADDGPARETDAIGTSAMPEGDLMESPAVRGCVALVRKAAGLVRTEGEKAFDLFRVQGGPWYQGDKYVFVNDMTGTIVVDPNRPEFQGTNQIDLRDQDGRPIIQLMIEEVSTADKEGWVHYMWPKFALSEPYLKSSFVVPVTAPSGKQYIVGSGVYDAGPQGVFVIDTVNDAVGLIEADGRDAFDMLRVPSGNFRYGNTYVSVIDQQGVELVNGAFPSFEDQNVLDERDQEGNYIIRDMIKGLEGRASQWFRCVGLAPGTANVLPKLSYVRKTQLDGDTIYVGSGLYLQD